MAMHVTGPVISSSGNLMAVQMRPSTTAASGASGTMIPAWRTTLPPFPMVLSAIGITFGGGPSAPQGGTFVVKVWSNGARKGLASMNVAGASFPAVAVGNLSFTLPASAAVRLTAHTVGGTAAGANGHPTLYLRHWG